jgi:ABC-2 type transport system ATP-binding protein
MTELARTQTIIKTVGLSKAYGDLRVLKSLDLEVPEHSIFGFLGPNGAGKTTTMKILLGLSTPTSGRAEIFGKDVQHSGLEIRSRLGYLPQHPTFPAYMTAREVLAFTGRFFFQNDGRALPRRIEEMLELVGLEDKADRKVAGFSGGERQRLGIAQAQIHHPELLILDEPAAALDPLGRHDVLSIMEKLRTRATIFYSTHILDDVQQVSDTVAILNQGELVAQGSINQLLAGDGETVYRLKVKGPWQNLKEKLSGQPWVSGLEITEGPESAGFDIFVGSQDVPENRLLREALAVPDLVVLEFRRKEIELEEAFIEIVKGGRDG